MTKKQKQEAEALSAHVGPFGFDLKGAGVKRWGGWFLIGLFLLGLLTLLVWGVMTFPGKVMGKTQEAVNKGTVIERKLEDFKRETRKHNQRSNAALEDLTDAVAEIQETLELQRASRDSEKNIDLGKLP